ncbi:DHA2 family efflux MFS transporter permease subunit [Streptomyces sp. TLI_171]|uniref:DHA2 family efflux MFS transporter permease subunit n=1 Tax=Streptomyces sp. TLI_171 TaxID=1938859 RepID=UPI000C4B0FF6|nr:DHA2 family efflux MFS transporter permease subunit [Streptomyces sp. TLI_171]RKE18904.1 EmrB/QacA subfamily drug resistance transporter [Streptomyces sp. TLI_171]
MIRHARTAPAAAPPDSDRIDPAVRRLALTVVVGALAVVFDTTVVTVALGDLAAGLHAPLATVQWVSTGYLLAVFTAIPLAGWAQARLGGKRLWIAALGTFLLGSVLCALARSAPALICFRIVQGLGGGIMMPLMATLVIQAARGRALGRVMAAVTLPTALGPILGPVLGGLILSLADWRWIFLVNLPFCAAGAWLAHRNLPDDRPAPDAPRPRPDVLGLLLLPPGTAAVLYGLSRVGTGHVLLPLLTGLALLAAFTARALLRPGALVDLRLLRHRPLASAAGLGFLAGAVLYGAMLLLPLYWQQQRGQDALGAGLALIPQGVGALLARTRAGALTDRLGPRPVALAGFALTAAATVPFALGVSNGLLLGAALVVRGLGLAAAMIPLGSAGYLGLRRAEIPDASIITRVAQQVGGSVGTALLAVVLQHGAFGTAFAWSAALTASAVPLCLLLPPRPAA